MPTACTLVALVTPSLLAAGACASRDATADEIGDRARDYRQLERINARPFPSARHQGNPLVDVWADALAAPAYRQLSAGIPALVPEGGMVVKEMRDAGGEEPILTVMVKQPTGYDPEHGDWWYGRLNIDGGATASGLTGKVTFCIACHAGAAERDYLFGVSADNLAPR